MFSYAKPEQKQTIQKKEAESKVSSPNLTGIPDIMKTRFENLSGFSFDDVRVHYNSDKPTQLQALAYTQGNQVYVASGQEEHLRHELGHVVQQKQGRVLPTVQVQAVNVNDNRELEREADVMWKQPIQYMRLGTFQQPEKSNLGIGQFVVQRVITLNEEIGLIQEFIDDIKTVSDDVRGVIEGWEGKEKAMSFASLDHFINSIMAERVHDTTSDLLGLPVNKISEEEQDGKDAAHELLNVIQSLRGIQGSEEDAAVRIKFMIHRAAAGVVTGVAVCDNYASLSAIIMRIIGLDDVRLKGASGHKTASAGGIEVDPWTDLVHSSRKAEDQPSTDDVLTIDPWELEVLFYNEIEICKRLLPVALENLTVGQKEAYCALKDNRQKTRLGNTVWRKEAQKRKEAKSAEILERMRKKK